MVVHAFPVVKLGIILLQQLSKPAVRVVSNMAVHNRIIHTYLYKSAIRFQNFEAKIHAGNTTQLAKLSEKQAIEKGAHLLSEVLLFIIASAIAMFQYKKANKNKAALDKQIKSLNTKIEQLEYALQTKS